MASALEKHAKAIGVGYDELAKKEGVARAINWEGLGGFFQLIAGIVVPLLEKCMENQTPTAVSERAREMGPLATLRLQVATNRNLREVIRNPFERGREARRLVAATKAHAESMSDGDMLAVLQEVEDT